MRRWQGHSVTPDVTAGWRDAPISDLWSRALPVRTRQLCAHDPGMPGGLTGGIMTGAVGPNPPGPHRVTPFERMVASVILVTAGPLPRTSPRSAAAPK